MNGREKINKMNNEKLAEIMAGYSLCRWCAFKQDSPECHNEPCHVGICKWLESEVEE